MFRLANSVHSKSGLYKISLEYRELADLGLGYVLDLARQPREHDSMAIPTQADKATQWMHQATAWVRRPRAAPAMHGKVRDHSGWRLPPCIRAVEHEVLPDGIRHAAYFEYARYLATIGAAPDEILRRLLDIDRRNSIHDDAHLESLAQRAARYAGFKTCPLPQLGDYCDRRQCFLAAQDARGASDAADASETRQMAHARPGQPNACRDANSPRTGAPR